MAIFDNLFGTQPEYLSGLLGADETEKLRKQATTTGLVNSAIALIAQPRNQRFGSALPYIGRALMAGQQAGQGVYNSALQGLETQQKLAELKRQQEQRKAFDEAAKNLYTTTAPKYQTVTQAGGYAPAQTEIQEGQVAPNFGMNKLPDVTQQVMTEPGRQELNQEALMRMAMTGDPRSAQVFSGLKTIRELNQPQEVEYKDIGDKLLPVYKISGQPVPGLNPLPKNLSPEQMQKAQWEQYKFANPSASDLLSAQTTRQGQAITMRGQDLTNARALENLGVQTQLKNLQAQKLQSELGQVQTAKQGAIDSYDTAISSLNRLKKHPGLSVAVGASIQPPIPFYGDVPGTDKADFNAELDTFKSQTFLPMVQNLKGMGALSDAEGKKLTDAVGALNTNMSEKAFKESLLRIEADLNKAKKRIGVNKTPNTQSNIIEVDY
jgi:hypothetical protein